MIFNILDQLLNDQQLYIRKYFGYHQRSVNIQATNDVERKLLFLSRLWDIDYTILNHNLKRLIQISNLFGANRIHRFSMSSHEVYLNEYDYSIALEFFLQMDQHLFYMKTCTYGGATRLSNEKCILSMDEPQLRYGMNQCHRTSCCLCHPLYNLTYRMDQPIVQFGPYHQHQFMKSLSINS